MTAAETLFRILAAPPVDDSGGEDRGRRRAGTLPTDRDLLPLDHPDRSQVDAIRRGESAAFEQMFVTYYAPLRDFARRLLASEEDAADVVEDIFLRVWQGRAKFNVHTSIAAYLYSAVRHGVVDVRRRQRTEGRFVTTWEPEVALQATTDAPSPSDLSEQREFSALLRTAMAALPERRRLALTLRWEGGLSHREIAAVLGIAPQSVANLLQRALVDLREMLPDDLE